MKTIQRIIVLATAFASSTAYAQYTEGVIKIGVLSDMSGLYADNGGLGSVTAAKLAVEDFGAGAKGMKVEIISADHQNKADAKGRRMPTGKWAIEERWIEHTNRRGTGSP
jgi:branched-chain amino acid transport system substrate-binding protein